MSEAILVVVVVARKMADTHLGGLAKKTYVFITNNHRKQINGAEERIWCRLMREREKTREKKP